MEQSYIILLIILTLGLIIKSNSLAIASTLLILMKLLKLESYLPKLESHGLKIGIIILTLGILSPIAENKYSIKDVLISIKSPLGLSALISALLIIMFTGKGYNLLTTNPSIVIPIIFGYILGIVIFKGVPVGPLVSAGMTVIIYNIIMFIYKFIR